MTRGTIVLIRDGSWGIKFIVGSVYRSLQNLFNPETDNEVLTELVGSIKDRRPLNEEILNKIPPKYKILLLQGNRVSYFIENIILLSCICDKSGKVIGLNPPFAGDHKKLS